jgi:hypothetical protein
LSVNDPFQVPVRFSGAGDGEGVPPGEPGEVGDCNPGFRSQEVVDRITTASAVITLRARSWRNAFQRLSAVGLFVMAVFCRCQQKIASSAPHRCHLEGQVNCWIYGV